VNVNNIYIGAVLLVNRHAKCAPLRNAFPWPVPAERRAALAAEAPKQIAAEAAPKQIAACAKPVARKRSKKLKTDGDGKREANNGKQRQR
jgi:hypothetical protein